MSFEMNKIIGAVLGAMILAMVCGIIADVLVNPTELAKPVYMVAGVKEAAPAAAAAKPKGPAPIGPYLAKADAAKGKELTRVCQACHTFAKGQPNKIGPNLYDVFDHAIAEGRHGYAFSDALKHHDKEKWTPALLNKWLSGPSKFAPGTKMTFAGLPKEQDRADIIAYLDSLSDHPVPLVSKKPAKPAAAKSGKGKSAPAKTPAPAKAPAPAAGKK